LFFALWQDINKFCGAHRKRQLGNNERRKREQLKIADCVVLEKLVYWMNSDKSKYKYSKKSPRKSKKANKT
jgi:hypothetical protein